MALAHEYQLQNACQNGNNVTVLERQDRCYDDYFVYLNCGVVGPKYPKSIIANSNSHSWTQIYTSLLSETIKMSGLTINVKFAEDTRLPSPMTHVQSMLFAVDRVGLRIIQDSDAIYDCGKSNAEIKHMDRRRIIYRYEMGLGKAILQAGYGLQSALGPMGPVKITSPTIPENPDHHVGNGSMPSWDDLVFFRSTGPCLLEDVHAELKYEGDFWEYIGNKRLTPDSEDENDDSDEDDDSGEDDDEVA